MPFDPTLPKTDSEMRSAEMRGQLNALHAEATVPETDPVFAASEAAKLVAGDKAKLDSAVQLTYGGLVFTGLLDGNGTGRVMNCAVVGGALLDVGGGGVLSGPPTGTGMALLPAEGVTDPVDLLFGADEGGPVLKDRATGAYYRLTVTAGVLGVEPVV